MPYLYNKVKYSFFKNRFSIPWFVLILIGLSVLVIYSNIYNNPFVFDDVSNIVENETIRDLSNYLSPGNLLKPRAIVDLTFALNYRFGKLNVFGYHLVNVLIHILNGFLVFFLVSAILKQAEFSSSSAPLITDSLDFSIKTTSLFAALIFVVHPIQTQAVTYTVQRYTSMAAMFYMASVLFYFKARSIQQGAKSKEQRAGSEEQRTDGGGQVEKEKNYKLKLSSIYTLSVFCGMLSFLSKQNTASLPLTILLVEYLLIDRTWQSWKKKLPWFVMFFVLWTFFILYVSGLFNGGSGGRGMLEDVSGLMKETETVGRWQYLCTQFNVLVIYIRLLFLPVQQNLDYLYPFKSGFFDSYTPLAFLFLIGLAAVGTRQIKKRPVISLAIFWFFITLSVESSIIPIRDALFEHRLYLPMFGFAFIVAFLLFNLLARQRFWAIVSSVVIIISFGATTYYRNSVWKNGLKLWSDVVSKSPYNYRAHNNLGAALNKQNRIEESIQHYLQALRIKPDYAEAHYNFGHALDNQDRTEEAIQHYLQALRIKPDYEKAHNNLGLALDNQGRTEEAIRHYLQALQIKPDYEQVHNNLGNALNKQGRTKEAIQHYIQALGIKPDFVDAHYNLGNALYSRGRTAEAIKHYLQTLRIKPGFAEAHYNLGLALYSQGHTEEAIQHFAEALRIKPDYEKAHNNLGLALDYQGRTEEAIEHYLQALRIKPDYVDAHNNLAVALFRKGNIEDAIAHFRKALRINPNDIDAKTNLKKVLMMQQQQQ